MGVSLPATWYQDITSAMVRMGVISLIKRILAAFILAALVLGGVAWPKPARATGLTQDDTISVSFLPVLPAEQWHDEDARHMSALIAQLPLAADKILAGILKEGRELQNLLDQTELLTGLRSKRGFVVYDIPTTLKIMALDKAIDIRRQYIWGYSYDDGPWGKNILSFDYRYEPLFDEGTYVSQGRGDPREWPDASAVVTALEDLDVADWSFVPWSDNPFEVFLVPYIMADLQGHPTQGFYAMPGAFIGAGPRNAAETAVHLFGHNYEQMLMPGPTAKPALWDEYMAIKGITNATVAPFGAADVPSAWSSSVREAFAEDFRVLFGNGAASASKNPTQWGDPRDNGTADRLKAWFLGLEETDFISQGVLASEFGWQMRTELAGFTPMLNLRGLHRTSSLTTVVQGARGGFPVIGITSSGPVAVQRALAGKGRVALFHWQSPEGVVLTRLPESATNSTGTGYFEATLDGTSVRNLFTDLPPASSQRVVEAPANVFGLEPGKSVYYSETPYFSQDPAKITEVGLRRWLDDSPQEDPLYSSYSTNIGPAGEPAVVYVPLPDGVYSLTLTIPGDGQSTATLILDTPEDPWSAAVPNGQYSLGSLDQTKKTVWGVVAPPALGLDPADRRLKVTLTGYTTASGGSFVPIDSGGRPGSPIPMKLNGRHFEAVVDLPVADAPYRLSLQLTEATGATAWGTVYLAAGNPANLTASEPRAFARVMFERADKAFGEGRMMDTLRALAAAVNYWDSILPGQNPAQPVPLNVYADGVKAATDALYAMLGLVAETVPQSFANDLARKSLVFKARNSGPYSIHGAPGLADATGHWAAPYLRLMAAKGVIKGFDDGTLRPDNPVGRLEALVMIERLMGLEEEARGSAATVSSLPYSDRLSIPAWGLGYAAVAAGHDLADVKSGRLRATDSCTRAEAAVMLVRALGPDAVQDAQSRMGRTSFADDSSIPSATRGYVIVAVGRGLIKGSSDNRFLPTKALSRAELSTMLNRLDGSIASSADSREVIGTVAASWGGKPPVLTVTTATGKKDIPLLMDAAVYRQGKEITVKDLKRDEHIRLLLDANGYAVVVESQE